MKQLTSPNKFATGMGFFFKGLSTLKDHPHLKKWFALPLIIDFLVFIVGLIYLGGFVQGWVLSLTTWLTGVLGFLQSVDWLFAVIYYPLAFIAWVAFFILWIYLTFIIGTVVAAPFNGLLAEKTLVSLGVISEEKFTVMGWIKFTLSMLMASLVKAVVFSLFGLILFICSFIPGLNVVSSFGALLIVAFDCFDYAYEVLGYGFGKRLNRFISDLPRASGMAASLGMTLVIPGSTLLLLPLGVLGATTLLAETEQTKNVMS